MALPAPGLYQTRAQRLDRLAMLAARERQRLQTQFRKEAAQTATTLGRRDALHDRFAPPPPEFKPPIHPTGRFGARFADVTGGGARFTQTSPEFVAAREKARRFGVDLTSPAEPSTLLGGVGAEENVPRRTIFGQEAQAFAEQVAPREHQRRLISEADVQGLGLPGRIAREASYVDPATLMLAPLFGPNVFGRGALEAAPTLKQLAGTALTAVGADIPVVAGEGRRGGRTGGRGG